MVKASIRAIRSHLPQVTLSNEDLAREFPEWAVEKVYDKTGIRNRHIAGSDETASDLAYAAALKLFSETDYGPDDVDYLLFCTQSPDYVLPTSACLLQQRLGLRTSVGALDFNLGCSGFIYGLSLAKGLVETGQVRNVLLLLSETYSKYLAPSDKSVRTIFGDGASAVLVSAVDKQETELLGPFSFGTDGSGGMNLVVDGSGARKAASGDGRRSCLHMNGPEILNFTLERIPQVVRELTDRAQLRLEEVDLFVFHQANKFILEQLRRKLKIEPDRFVINMANYGNTVSATIPMALELELKERRVKKDARVMFVGFGVGYSWGACLAHLTGI